MQTVYLGIDPGQTGAVALIGPDSLALVEPWPGDVVAAADLVRGWVAVYCIELAAVERVASRPGQGQLHGCIRLGCNDATLARQVI